MLIETLLVLLSAITPYNETPKCPAKATKEKQQVAVYQPNTGSSSMRGGWDFN